MLDGVEQPVIDGRSAATFIYGGFFRDHIARPGSMREMLRNVKKGAMTDASNPVVGPADRAWFERDARLELMDRQHVASTLLFPSTGVCVEPTFQGDKATLYANYKAFNRWLAEDWGLGADGRLYGAPLISLLDVDEAVAELDWALDRGCKVINLTAGPAYGRSPADPHFDPFWARMDEARVICGIHVGDAGYNRRNAAAWGEDVRPHRLRTVGVPVDPLLRRPADHGDDLGADLRQPLRSVPERQGGQRRERLAVRRLPAQVDGQDGRHGPGGPWPGGRLSDKPSEIFRQYVYVSPFHEEDIAGPGRH